MRVVWEVGVVGGVSKWVNIVFMMAGCHMQVASEDGDCVKGSFGLLARDRHVLKSISMVGRGSSRRRPMV